jgi:hypothetical protein
MNKVKTKLSWLGILAVIFVCSGLAQAQANRTWVASTGLDTNTGTNCPQTAPCRTFGAALGVTNPKGSISVVDGAEYCGGGGSLSITKSVTIDGNGVALCSAPSVSLNAVNVFGLGVNDIVILRNLRFNGFHLSGVPDAQAFGVSMANGGTLVIENDHFQNFSGGGVAINASGGVAPGPGGSPAAFVHIRNSFFDSNEHFGVSVTSTGPGLAYFDIDGCHISNNGVFGSGVGVFAQDRAQGMISNTVIEGNQGDGVLTQPTTGTVVINMESCVVVHNNRGVDARSSGGSSIIRLSNTDIFENESTGIDYTAGNFITSFGNNRIAGNGAGNGPPTNTLPQQ